MWNQGGTGSNEILTLLEVAERLGIERARPERTVISHLRKLEQDTGRHILVVSGSGKGRRYLVIGREMEAALDGERSVDGLAEKIAGAVQRIEQRVTDVSMRLDGVARRVDAIERRVA